MAPHHFPIHSNKLWFNVNNEITLISAKFSATLYDQHTSCKTVARCLALYDALTTTQASIASSLMSFFYDVILHCRPLHVRNEHEHEFIQPQQQQCRWLCAAQQLWLLNSQHLKLSSRQSEKAVWLSIVMRSSCCQRRICVTYLSPICKALPCVIARNLSHCAWKSVQGSLQ